MICERIENGPDGIVSELLHDAAAPTTSLRLPFNSCASQLYHFSHTVVVNWLTASLSQRFGTPFDPRS
jgi:hypothetical protein